MTKSHLTRNISTIFALFILILLLCLAIGAPLITAKILHTDPTSQDLINSYEPLFSVNHFLGTDELGRDVLTRILYALRISLLIGFAVSLLQAILGVPLGLVAGYHGFWIDDLINAILQTVRGIPIFYLLIVLSVLFRPSLINLIFIMSIIGWTGTCRQVRGLVFSIKQRKYIEAAKALGGSDNHLLLRHILPNVSSVILISISFNFASTIITESSLSFLGFGVQAPTPSLGNMLSGALSSITFAPWLIIMPGILITIIVYCAFIISDGINDLIYSRL
jgi:peptide/nickel transport system permease protein